MHKVIRAKSETLFPVIQEIIKDGSKTVITVTGNSMRPFLRENVDSVELSKADFNKIFRGDIVLVHRDFGAYVLHRVIRKKKNCFYMVGDNQQWVEGPLRPDQIVAVATAVFRGEKRTDCKNVFLKVLVNAWLGLLPFRPIVRKLLHYPHAIVRRIINKTSC